MLMCIILIRIILSVRCPKDVKITRISRTIGKNQVVDELILSYTHDIEIKAHASWNTTYWKIRIVTQRSCNEI